jgi:pantoate--beta-alanine ligase
MTVRLVHSACELDAALAPARKSGRIVGLVPTMGALHEGHGRLLDQARRECGSVAASIFVNPIQFNQPEDYNLYPRDLDADLEFCRARGVDIVFAPSITDMYPQPQRTFVEVERLTDSLCGTFRPGHFRGVATVVLKLFQLVRPARAYFGEKDYQQLAVIRRMVADLNVPVAVIGVPTVRECDGLAMSSRNRRLDASQRAAAAMLYRALQAAARLVAAGEASAQRVKDEALAILCREPQLRLEYLEIVDPAEIVPVEAVHGEVRIAAAVWLGPVRLIDNVPAAPPD